MKRCSRCSEMLPKECFHPRRDRPDGLQYHCRNCNRLAAARWAERNRERCAFRGARNRAKSQKVPFTLVFGEMESPRGDDCPCCGYVMDWTRKRRWHSPSLDRLVPALGYTSINTWWICTRCNTRKSNSTPEQMYQIADAVYAERRRRGLDAGTRSDD